MNTTQNTPTPATEAPATTWNRWLDRFLAETDKFTLDPALHQKLRWLPNGSTKALKNRLVFLDFQNATGTAFLETFHALGL